MSSYPLPEHEYTIYTKSKCDYCARVKEILPTAHVILCDDYLERDRDGFRAFMDLVSCNKPRTFPMVFHNGQYIGGYDDSKDYVDKLEAFLFVDF